MARGVRSSVRGVPSASSRPVASTAARSAGRREPVAAAADGRRRRHGGSGGTGGGTRRRTRRRQRGGTPVVVTDPPPRAAGRGGAARRSRGGPAGGRRRLPGALADPATCRGAPLRSAAGAGLRSHHGLAPRRQRRRTPGDRARRLRDLGAPDRSRRSSTATRRSTPTTCRSTSRSTPSCTRCTARTTRRCRSIEIGFLVADAQDAAGRHARPTSASGAGSDLPAEVRADVDLYLTVARQLLGDTAAGAGGRREHVTQIAAAGRARAGGDAASARSSLFGETRDVDFSQFKPRGHYAGDTDARALLPSDDLARPHRPPLPPVRHRSRRAGTPPRFFRRQFLAGAAAAPS